MWPFRKEKSPDPIQATDYDSFAQQCIEEVRVLQDKFQSDYNMTWYENWFYNQSTGLLTFSTDNKELNFKYFDVGSFSEKSKTWKWSWDNEHTLDTVKEQAWLAKEFGDRLKYEKLTTGCFPSEEAEAWEFTAIAAKLTNGIGIYRPVGDDQLKIFLVITEFVDNATAKKIKDRYVQCSEHEYRRVAFVCNHLNQTNRVGFNEAFETYEGMALDEDDDFQAWCDECEKVRERTDGWDEESIAFADIKVVCEKCYFEMKALNLQN